MQHQMKTAEVWASTRNPPVAASFGQISADGGMNGFGNDLIDYPVANLGDWVVHHPTGRDAGPLTGAIARCRARGDYSITLSNVGAYITQHGLDTGLNGRTGNVRIDDANALNDHRDMVKTYYRRVVPAGHV